MRAAPRFPAARVLVVEDSRDVLDLITVAFGRQGWQVEAAVRADEGLARLAERHYDLVIAHLGLPDRRATEMLREAREAGHLTTTAVLMITGQANPDNPDEFPGAAQAPRHRRPRAASAHDSRGRRARRRGR